MAKQSQRKKEALEAKQVALAAEDETEKAAIDALWNSLSDEQRDGYLAQVRNSLPTSIDPGINILVILAKSLAQESIQSGRHGRTIGST